MACKSFLKISVISRNMGVFLSTFLIKSLKDQASSSLTLELIYLHVMQISLQQHTWVGGIML